MPKGTSNNSPAGRKAIDPDARENQLIALAVDLAEQQLREGTASAQVITHYLKLAASKADRELDRQTKERELELITAKTDNLKSTQRIEDMYAEAMSAFSTYSGKADGDYHD